MTYNTQFLATKKNKKKHEYMEFICRFILDKLNLFFLCKKVCIQVLHGKTFTMYAKNV